MTRMEAISRQKDETERRIGYGDCNVRSVATISMYDEYPVAYHSGKLSHLHIDHSLELNRSGNAMPNRHGHRKQTAYLLRVRPSEQSDAADRQRTNLRN